MYRFFRFCISLISSLFGGSLAFWYLVNHHATHNPVMELTTIMCFTIGFALIAIVLYALYVFYLSKDVNHVEEYINKVNKSTLYVAIRYLVKGEYQKLHDYLPKIKNYQKRAYIEASLMLEEQNIEAAENIIKTLHSKTARNTLNTTLAIVKRDWETFEQLKEKIKHKGHKYVLEADAAYRKGKLDEAKQFGNLAISPSRGLQRYILIKSLERQEANPNRVSYFSIPICAAYL